MATVGAMADMEHAARQRITAAIATLSERHGVEFVPPPFERNPGFKMIRELEANATFLEALAKGGGPVSGSGELATLEADAQADGVTLTVAETKDGKPVVATASDKPKRGKG